MEKKEGLKGKSVHIDAKTGHKIRYIFEVEPHHEIATFRVTLFNYLNIILGPFLFCMPVVFYYTKLILGIILTLLVAYIFWISIFFIVTAGRLTGATSFTKMALSYHSWKGYYGMVFILTVEAVINLIIFNILMADNLSKTLIILNADWSPPEDVRDWLLVTVNVAVIFPLCRVKHTGFVSKFGIASLVVFVLNFIIMCIYYLGFVQTYLKIEWEIRHFAVEIALTFPILCTGFSTTHCNFFLNKSLKKNHSFRWNTVTIITHGTTAIITIFMGFGALLLFSNFIQGNLLNNFCIEDMLMQFVRFMVTIMVILHYPVHFLTLRELFKTTLFLDELSGARLLFVTVIILSLTTGSAVLYSCVEVYMIVNGIFTSIPLTCIFSPYFYLRATNAKKQTWKKIQAVMLIVLGCILFVYCILNLYIEMNKQAKETCLFQNSNPYCEEKEPGKTIEIEAVNKDTNILEIPV